MTHDIYYDKYLKYKKKYLELKQKAGAHYTTRNVTDTAKHLKSGTLYGTSMGILGLVTSPIDIALDATTTVAKGAHTVGTAAVHGTHAVAKGVYSATSTPKKDNSIAEGWKKQLEHTCGADASRYLHCKLCQNNSDAICNNHRKTDSACGKSDSLKYRNMILKKPDQFCNYVKENPTSKGEDLVKFFVYKYGTL